MFGIIESFAQKKQVTEGSGNRYADQKNKVDVFGYKY